MPIEILRKLNIESLNPMQEAALQAAAAEADLVLLSPTGSGKTLAFLLPLIPRVNAAKTGVQALILVPSRELGIQIEQVFRKMGTGLKVNCFYGGHSTRTEKNNLNPLPSVLIGTPGRIAYHLRRNSFDPSTVQSLVLDEFDKALEFGFQEEMSFIIQKLVSLEKRILTSATELKEIPDFVGLHVPSTLNFLSKESLPGLKQKIVLARGTDKLEALFALVCKTGGAPGLIFCNHRDAVDRISELLKAKGISHGIFHGGMDQDQREKALIKLRNGTWHLLVTTDLASRGLDIPAIENVIHYQLPGNETIFLHRNGRTARMHASGTSYLILGEGEHSPEYLKEKPETEILPKLHALPPKSEWITLFLGAGKKEKINKVDIVGLLIQKGQLKKEELGLIEVLDHCAYVAVKRTRAEEALRLIRNEKIKKKSVKIGIAE